VINWVGEVGAVCQRGRAKRAQGLNDQCVGPGGRKAVKRRDGEVKGAE
jgi:hypothetical protein